MPRTLQKPTTGSKKLVLAVGSSPLAVVVEAKSCCDVGNTVCSAVVMSNVSEVVVSKECAMLGVWRAKFSELKVLENIARADSKIAAATGSSATSPVSRFSFPVQAIPRTPQKPISPL